MTWILVGAGGALLLAVFAAVAAGRKKKDRKRSDIYPLW